MSNFNQLSPTAEIGPSSNDARNHFKNRTLSSERKFTLPRRYVMALLLCLLSVLEITRDWNMREYALKPYPAFENWTGKEYYKLKVSFHVVDIFVNMLGGLLIYRFSSHKFLLVSVGVSSILQILIPTAQDHSLAFLLVVVIGREISSVSVFTAILSMWKDWAPPDERSVLLAVSFLGVATKAVDSMFSVMSMRESYIYNVTATVYPVSETDTGQCFVAMERPIKSQLSDLMKTCGVAISDHGLDLVTDKITAMVTPYPPATHLPRDTTPENTALVLGIAGIIWVLFWYNITSSTPQCDPLITEKEYFYLESKIPANYQENISLKDVPWLSMVKCKQVIFLFLLFFKFGCSMYCLQWGGMKVIMWFPIYFNGDYIKEVLLKKCIPFFVLFLFVLLGSSLLMDNLLNYHRDKALFIRRTFMCTGFIMQSVILVPACFANRIFFRSLSCAIAYLFFAISIPGLLRIPLDLAPRYVSIVAGFGFAFYSLGFVCFPLLEIHNPDLSYYWNLIFDAIISLFTGFIFLKWGEVEERTWSVLTPSRRRGKDFRSYPEPDKEDDVILTPSE